MFSTKFLKARSSSIRAFKSDEEGEEATETGCVGDMALLQVKKMNDALTIHVYSLKFLSYIFNHLVFIIPYRLNIKKQFKQTAEACSGIHPFLYPLIIIRISPPGRRHASDAESPYFCRRTSRSRLLRHSAASSLPQNPAHAPAFAQYAVDFRADGYGDGKPAGDCDGAAGRDWHYPQECIRRAAGEGSGQGQTL